jgi:hypothetical protein
MSLLILPVSLDTCKNLTPGFLLLSNYLLLSPDPFLLLPVTPPPPSRHVWDDHRVTLRDAKTGIKDRYEPGM